MKRLHPLFPDTSSLNGCRSSSMHRPSVMSATRASGSICHHLQSLQRPHCSFMTTLLPQVETFTWFSCCEKQNLLPHSRHFAAFRPFAVGVLLREPLPAESEL